MHFASKEFVVAVAATIICTPVATVTGKED